MFQLRDYQQDLVTRARSSFQYGYKAPCIVSPCGSGKSVVISEIARLTINKGGRVLFLVHRKELIDQIQETFEQHGVNMDFVEFGMVQTVVKRLDKTAKPSLIITDESHHGLASSYRKIYDHFSDVLRLSFTATPIRLDGSGLKEVNDILIEGVSVSWLIENKCLSPFRCFSIESLDRSHLKKKHTGDFSNDSITLEFERNKNIIGDIIEHYRKLADGTQAIAYCHSIEFSKKVEEMFSEEGIPAAHIDGTTPKNERNDIIQSFRDKKIQVLCNVDLIGEGFDVPDCSTVILLRPTQSLSLHIQQCMRGMRYKEGKTSIIIDHVGNIREHGLPDAKRVWSLDSKKKQKKAKEEDDVSIQTCEECFSSYPAEEGNTCPYCGHVHEVERKDKEYVRNAELVEVNSERHRFNVGDRVSYEWVYPERYPGTVIRVKENHLIVKMDEEWHRGNDKDVNVMAPFEEWKLIEPAFTLDLRSLEDCKSMSELYDLAKSKGFKPGWAWYQGKRLGLINKK